MNDATTGGTTAMPQTPAYPERWEADVVLADGATAHVRPIRPDDGPRIADFHGRQPAENIYFRYFTPRPQLTDAEIEHLTHVDYVNRMAFVALQDEQLIGVARYDRWPTRSEAEVAFFVDDRHQGRGLGTLLLEYLASAARQTGIGGFTATVLPTNQRMLGVFRQAGFQATSSFEDGVIEVRLDLQPTPEAEAAIEARARRAEAQAVRRMLAPRSVAVIGASRDPSSVGHAVLRNLLLHEFAGPVYPVNRAADQVAGVPAVASVSDIGGPVDVAVVAVPAAEVPAVIEDCGRKGAWAAVIISAGFAESGAEGAALSAATLRTARRFGVRLLGPNCLGVINTHPEVRLHATFATPHPRPGPVALLSESGTIGAVILDHLTEAGLGTSSFAAIGNRADISANDLLQYWADDPRTELLLLYLESFGNARKFSRIARDLTRTKPVVAVKSAGAARAYPVDAAHADLPWPTVDALLQQTGIIRVDTLAQLRDVARILVGQPLPAGDRVALVGNGGGSLALAADACVDAGLRLAELGPGVRAAVGPRARLRASTIDLGFEADRDDLERALRAVLTDDGVDSVLAVCAPAPRQATPELIRAIEAARQEAAGKPLVACVFGPHPAVVAQHGTTAVPVFDFPDDAAYALGRVTQYAGWRAEPEGRLVVPDGVDLADARRRTAEALAGEDRQPPAPPGEPGEREARWLPPLTTGEVLAAGGLAPITSRLVDDPDAATAAAAEVGFPVVAKAVRRPRLAKTEAGGIALDVHDENELRATLARMGGALGAAAWPLVIQPMAEPGVDAAVTVTDHPIVGPVLTLGPGGAATSLGAVENQVLPLTDREAARLVDRCPLARLLDAEARSRLEDLLLRVSALVDGAPEIVGLELNPVILTATGAAIADARLQVAPVERDPLPPVRRL